MNGLGYHHQTCKEKKKQHILLNMVILIRPIHIIHQLHILPLLLLSVRLCETLESHNMHYGCICNAEETFFTLVHMLAYSAKYIKI